MTDTAALTLFAPPRLTMERRADGALLLRSRDELGPYAVSMAHVLRRRAAEHPDRLLAAERDGDGWARLTWGEADERARAISQALLDRGLGPQRPLMILSGNGLAHLLLVLGAYAAGVPVTSISTAYSLQSSDHERIRAIAELCRPGLVFADDAEAYGPALDALAAPPSLTATPAIARGERRGAIGFDELTAATPGARADAAFAALGPDTVAKILFTSGSTGRPKGVVNTHRMMCSNQQALGQIWPFLREEPPVLVDWLPWSHTFGANHDLNQVIVFGGSLYIDDGRPAPALFHRSVAALDEVRPTVYYNVPAGYALLAPRLESDPEFARRFFSRLRLMFYAAAPLTDALWDRLQLLAARHADHPVPLTASWGTTETAPLATSAHFHSARCGCIGVPVPGVTLKLVPTGEKLEIRLTGPNVTPGYLGDDAATAAAFDAEGYYRTGDAVRLIDAADPAQGLMFDGRLAEDFKLATGTWVRVGQVRNRLVSAAGGVLGDAVICGHDGASVCALAWLNMTEAQRVAAAPDDVAIDHPALRAHLARALAQSNRGAGSALRVERLLLLSEPPAIDAGEITDKGYINQRAVIERRAGDVARLLADPPPAAVITADDDEGEARRDGRA